MLPQQMVRVLPQGLFKKMRIGQPVVKTQPIVDVEGEITEKCVIKAHMWN